MTGTLAKTNTFDRNSELAEAVREYIRCHKSEYDHTHYSDLAVAARDWALKQYPSSRSTMSRLDLPFLDFCLNLAFDSVAYPTHYSRSERCRQP